jgi:hypothetical protein
MIQIKKQKMDGELMFVCNIESDGSHEKLENAEIFESSTDILEGPEQLRVPFEGLMIKDEKNV